MFDPLTHCWSKITILNSDEKFDRNHFGSVKVENKIYICGGTTYGKDSVTKLSVLKFIEIQIDTVMCVGTVTNINLEMKEEFDDSISSFGFTNLDKNTFIISGGNNKSGRNPHVILIDITSKQYKLLKPDNGMEERVTIFGASAFTINKEKPAVFILGGSLSTPGSSIGRQIIEFSEGP